MNANKNTGYETYTPEERSEMIVRLTADLRYERTVSEGEGLRAEIARASCREYERQIAAIRRTV